MFFIKKKFLILFIIFFNISGAFAVEKVVFIDIDYLLNNSNFGKIIFKELDKVNKENIKLLEVKEKAIKERKDKINQTKNISSEEKLKKDIKVFNEDVEKFRLEKEKLLTDFKILKEQKLTNFLKKINPIIQNYMENNSIDIVLEKKQIFIGSGDKDITNDIMLLINKG
ncbi:OmpH family outer membrane protein [Candidatus Pelagibacter sp. HIMB123]|uniref:OmpH family outer membrane protein n=1 Tax=Candidatus Pelagibacter sp. HIMB123 TaxID=3415413 RepID=UPI003F85B3E5